MNKKGVTILELLISISMISLIILMLIKLMFSLENINNGKNYASNDEITRTNIIKTIESDFLKLKLNGIKIIDDSNSKTIVFTYETDSKTLTIKNKELIYDDEKYTLKSPDATYDNCLKFEYILLDNNYYYLELNIPVLINNKNTTSDDDITLSYLGLKNKDSNYPLASNCLKNNN